MTNLTINPKLMALLEARGIEVETKAPGRINEEIASAILDSLDGIYVDNMGKKELKSITQQVIDGLSKNINWYDEVRDIVTGTEEYAMAISEEELKEDNENDEEFGAEEDFSLDTYFENDENMCMKNFGGEDYGYPS